MAERHDATYGRKSYRRAYDTLAWDSISALLPPAARIVDAGIGAGRWLERLPSMGHRVTGIEQAPAMIAILRGCRCRPASPCCGAPWRRRRCHRRRPTW